ncbi:MAG: divalent-cation tolerance protein CutA [Burkholderiales bacterium]|jgi:periplasmic divalent cation tolerance protein|nr:divalent-cation tolerance protein CutA [Burkholderiales bacterium]
MAAILVITNVATFEDAKTMSRSLVTDKLCACVNIASKCHSVYSWQGKVEEAEEYTLLIKTTKDKYAELEDAIKSMHKYEVPEIIAIDITNGLPAYLSWVNSNV